MKFMNKLNEVIFLNSYPSLDLHGYDRDTARVAINDFINDNITMKNEIIVIIHGVGQGILQKQTHETLRKNKNVIAFKQDNFNNGCTLVQIKID